MLAFVPFLLVALAACWGPPGKSTASRLVSHALSSARAHPPRRDAATRGKALLKGQLGTRAASAEAQTPKDAPGSRAEGHETPALPGAAQVAPPGALPGAAQVAPPVVPPGAAQVAFPVALPGAAQVAPPVAPPGAAQAALPVAQTPEAMQASVPAAAQAEAETPPAQESAEPPLPASTTPPGAVERVSLGGGAFLLVPPGLDPADGPYDLILHFHGVAPPLERALGSTGLRAVVVDVNVGAGSGPYATIVREGVVNLDRVISKIERTMARRSPGFASVRVGRVALSAWSAGYGSVLRLLSSPRVAERVDAVLLADCPHAGFRDAARRQVGGTGLEPLMDYGRRAMRGERLLAITHSNIETIGYASTRETTDFLLRSLGLPRRRSNLPGPGRMVRTSFAEAGGFSVSGYEGVDAAAHGDHLRNLDATLFPRLRRRWGRAPVVNLEQGAVAFGRGAAVPRTTATTPRSKFWWSPRISVAPMAEVEPTAISRYVGKTPLTVFALTRTRSVSPSPVLSCAKSMYCPTGVGTPKKSTSEPSESEIASVRPDASVTSRSKSERAFSGTSANVTNCRLCDVITYSSTSPRRPIAPSIRHEVSLSPIALAASSPYCSTSS